MGRAPVTRQIQRIGDDLVHVEVAIGAEATDEGHVALRLGTGDVAGEKIAIGR